MELRGVTVEEGGMQEREKEPYWANVPFGNDNPTAQSSATSEPFLATNGSATGSPKDQYQNQQASHHMLSSHPIHPASTPISTFNAVGPQECITFFDAGMEDRTPSPPTSDRSSPANGVMGGNIVYESNTMSPFSTHSPVNGLAMAQQQLKSRSKMHEMAVRQRLITDQVC
ncbi:unnamed protein product [Strongylus vulgaris]|uniref:Uncharacterized protein n=1 Tax=Strongylus vulgaris TaxID=40348 RepID=A0A3P7K4F3_STRVU|nr:unnamed protein product [Strongylus vulgaris]